MKKLFKLFMLTVVVLQLQSCQSKKFSGVSGQDILITGRIVGLDKKPIANTQIRIPKYGLSGVSGADGKFTLSGNATGINQLSKYKERSSITNRPVENPLKKNMLVNDTLLASAAGYITAKVNLGSLKTDVGDVVLMQAGDSESIIIVIDTDSPGENLGAAKVEEALKAQGKNPVVVSLSTAGGQEHIRVQKTNGDPQIKKEGYRLKNEDGKWVISAQDIAGSIYGLMDLAEQIQIKKGLDKVTAKLENPKLALRAVKFNIPWSSYRRNKALQSNDEICKDLKFWEGFLNMMVENRLNSLSLWNMHPFPYMIRTKNFPKATSLNNQELAEYQHLYKSIFKMAKDRGIETYQMTWNIFVSEAFTQNYGPGRDDLGKFKADAVYSKQIGQYLRESMIQLIEEYPNLTGIGMALGEGMDDYNLKQQEQFAEEVFFRAVREAN
jgi:hypothetical protein